MEIEKKYLVNKLPDNIDSFPHEEIEQAYLCDRPTLRIRRRGDRYIFTYKGRVAPDSADTGLMDGGSGDHTYRSDCEKTNDRLCVADEVERPLTREAYEHLREKADGIVLTKTRYRIPYNGYTIELDLFHGEYEGFILAEVEFPTVEEGQSFTPPDWFGEDVSGDVRYTNNYMSKKHPTS